MDCENIPLPKMCVSYDLGKKRKDLYTTSGKFAELSNIIGKPESISFFISKPSFLKLLNTVVTKEVRGIRIYFANYPDTILSNFQIPKGFEKQLTIIIAPTKDSDQTDSGSYYALNRGGSFVDIGFSMAKEWVNDYRFKGKLSKLTSIIGKPDTQCILYEIGHFSNLSDEIKKCQKNIMSGVRVYFSCLTDNEKESNQLVIQFVLTKKVGSNDIDYYIDKEFPHRPKPTKPKFLDTGNPCPPPDDKPCPGAKLLQ